MNRPKPRVTKVLLERRARALKQHIKAAIDGDGTGVHQARVASRRLREAVPVLARGVKGSKAGRISRKMRRLTRALGTFREADVTLALLDELATHDTLPRLALEEVRRDIIDERDRRRTSMLKRLETVNLSKLDRRLVTMADALQQAEGEEWRKLLGTRLMKRAKALGAAVADAGQMYAPERLHTVRITVKKLRYGLEIAAETGVRPAAAPVRSLKRAQDSLGRLHDFQVLQTHVKAVQAKPSEGGQAVNLEVMARAIEDECRHLHGHYVALIPALTEVVDTTRRVVVPLIVRSSRSRRLPMKMTLGTRTRRRAKTEPHAASSRA
jgi:CHAD domain-containing protein